MRHFVPAALATLVVAACGGSKPAESTTPAEETSAAPASESESDGTSAGEGAASGAGGETTGGWPKQDATIAGSGGTKDITHKTVRLWEVAGLLQSLLGGVATAQQVTDGGGDPVKWPPHMSF